MCRCSKSIPSSCKGMQVFKYLYLQNWNNHFLWTLCCHNFDSGVIWRQNVELCATITTSAWFCPLLLSQNNCWWKLSLTKTIWGSNEHTLNIRKRLKYNTIMTVTDKSTVGGDLEGLERAVCQGGHATNAL